MSSSFVAQSLMRVKCKGFEPQAVLIENILKYERIYEENKDYLDYHSASSDELQVCFVKKDETRGLKAELEQLKEEN